MKNSVCNATMLILLALVGVNGCGMFGPSREQRVIQGLQSRKETRRMKTLTRLKHDITPSMRKPLENVLETAINPTARALAADRLGQLGSSESAPALRLSSRRDSSWVVRRRALRALGKVVGNEISDDLRHTLKRDSRATVRVEAVSVASEQLNGAALKKILLAALQDESPVVRIAAQQKLVEITGKSFPPSDYEQWEKAVETD